MVNDHLRSEVFLDHKGVKEFNECMGTGFIKVSGCNLFKTLRNLNVNRITDVSEGGRTTYRRSYQAKEPRTDVRAAEKATHRRLRL